MSGRKTNFLAIGLRMQKFCTFVALTFLFAAMGMAQVPGGSQLRGMAEMKNGLILASNCNARFLGTSP